MSICKSLIFATAALWMTNWAMAAGPAEYAFRWEVAKGGPSTVDEVALLLQLETKKSKVFQVQYFDVTQVKSLPTGYTALGRERGQLGENPDATYKVRGPEPIPLELLSWMCPLEKASESKAEVDVSFLGPDQFKRTFSVSCTLDKERLKNNLLEGYSAVAKGCSSRMERSKANSPTLEVKIEKWMLPQERVVIEVSMAGDDVDSDLKHFRDKVVRPLMHCKAVPLKESKTELGGDC